MLFITDVMNQTFHNDYRIILYLKMFMGMGFFWSLEIVAGLLQEGSNAVKDLENETMSIHDKFKEIEELSNDVNWKHGKRCCADHSYVFQDLCEVYLR